MTNQRRTACRVLAAAVAMSASAVVAFTPTKASAFDIGGLIGTAIAVQMGQHHGGYSSGGHSHTHVARSDSGDSGSTPAVERDARDPAPVTPPPSDKSDNRGAARGQKTQGPSSLSGGIAQASVRDVSERDAATGQVASAGKLSDDAPAFNPSR